MIYKLMNAGVLPSAKIANTRRIPVQAVRELAAMSLTTRPRLDGGDDRIEEAADETAASQNFPTK